MKRVITLTILSVALYWTACGKSNYPVRTVYVYAEDTAYVEDATATIWTLTGRQAVELIQAQSDSIFTLTANARAFIKAADAERSSLRKQLEHCRR